MVVYQHALSPAAGVSDALRVARQVSRRFTGFSRHRFSATYTCIMRGRKSVAAELR